MGKRNILIIFGLVLLVAVTATISSCKKIFPEMINPENGLCGPISLTSDQTILFSAGNDQFFAVRTAATGLRPLLRVNQLRRLPLQ